MRRIVFTLVFAFLPLAASAQSQPGVMPAFSSLERHEYDTINLSTLGIQLNAPVRSKAGHIPFQFRLTGAVQIQQITSGNVVYWQIFPSLQGQEVHLGSGSVGYRQSGTSLCSGQQHNNRSNWYYTDKDGTTHTLPTALLWDSSVCGATSASGYTTDGSGIFVSWAYSGIVYAIDGNGNKVSGRTSFTDPNGNAISYSQSGSNPIVRTFTDSLAQTALTQTLNFSQPPTTPAETDSWSDALNNSQSINYYTSPLTWNTTFGCNWNANGAQTWNFPSKIVFPDQSTLTYSWETVYNNSSQYTGRLASIKLPTGGTITYTYSGGTNGVNCTDGSTATMTRTTPDGRWIYTHSAPSGGPWTTTVTDPANNNIVYTLDAGSSAAHVIEEQTYNGAVSAGNLIETVITCYNNPNSTPTNCGSLSSPYVTEKDVYTTYPGVSGYSAVKTAYDSYGRVTDVKVFDFNASSPTTEKQIAYGTGNPTSQSCSAIVNTYIINKPCSVTLLDSQHGNAVLSQTWNSYDSNGNLVQTWNLVSGSGSSGTYLSKQYTYSSQGVVQTSTDVNGQVMNYTTTSCNNMFVTSQYPTNFSNLQTSQVWDCNGGVVTSAKDANGQTTQTAFFVNSQTDPFYRPLQKIDELGYTTGLSYTTNSTESVFNFNGGQSTIDALSTTDSIGRPVVAQLRQAPGSTNLDSKSRSFDNDGRVYQTSLPCVNGSGSGCSPSTESQTYDALNRPLVHTGTGGEIITKQYIANDVLTTLTPAPTNEHAKATQKEYDGLGRLKSVCVISSASGSGSCGQTNAQTGFLTTYSYDAAGHLLQVVENAQVSSPQQSRSYTYDKLGRVLTESNPESGTRTYTYDSVSGTICTSTSQGDLVEETDANGNTSCHHYDTLHRETYTTYAGPNSNNTSKYFVYDAATVNNVTMQNVEGRMAEAYTCAGSNPPPCSSKITDEGFSYDARGQMTDLYQSSPNSGGYYHLSASYWEDGQTKAISGVGLPTITYGGLDGEGRVTTVTASSGTNPVSGVTYNNGTYANEPIGALLSVTVGNGDAQNFTYDKNTGRMTSYAASVGSTPVTITGSLTWNPNGTLAENNIIDGYNSANTQDCKYLYDDFMRVASGLDSTPGVKCMNGTTNIWNQTFAYDQFGNITKSTSGPGSAWAPGYNTANNHYTLANTVYDSNGNLTDDTFHSYTWLADGHEATIKPSAHGTDPTTTSTLYDALGNKVEETVNGTTHEYVSGFGVSAQMTGQTLASANVGLPGGVQALYIAAGLTRFRFPDWQGSIRAESKPGDRVFSESVAFAPFGERYALKGAPYNVDSFTGKPDQLVNDEYDFLAREEHNGQGRWISPDPMRGTGNKYVYANNNPLSNVDVYGLLAITVEGMETDTDVNPAESPTSAPHSESFQAKSQEAANDMGFLCSALDCSTPGTSDMLEGMGLAAAPQTQTTSRDTSAQTKTEQAKGQPEKTAQNQELSKKSEAAIENSALTGEQAGAFESAVKATGSADGINPNALVGIAFKESSLNPAAQSSTSTASGLFGLTDNIKSTYGLSAADATGTSPSAITKQVSAAGGYLHDLMQGSVPAGHPSHQFEIALGYFRGTRRSVNRAMASKGGYKSMLKLRFGGESLRHYISGVESFQ